MRSLCNPPNLYALFTVSLRSRAFTFRKLRRIWGLRYLEMTAFGGGLNVGIVYEIWGSWSIDDFLGCFFVQANPCTRFTTYSFPHQSSSRFQSRFRYEKIHGERVQQEEKGHNVGPNPCRYGPAVVYCGTWRTGVFT